MAGHLTAKFFQTGPAMLQEKLAEITKTLGSAKPEQGVEMEFAQARELAESAANELGRLAPYFGDQSVMGEVKAKLAGIFGQAVALENSLKK